MPRAALKRTGLPLADADWTAFATRDPSARGRFVIGVVTWRPDGWPRACRWGSH
jgi:hypothetical protein